MLPSNTPTHTPRRHGFMGVRIQGNGDLQLVDSIGKRTTAVTPIDLGLTRESVIARAKTWRPTHMQLKDKPALEQVFGRTSSGALITTQVIELVWNDQMFVDGVYGAGTYRRYVNVETREALQLAGVLFGSQAYMVQTVAQGKVQLQ